MDMVEGVLVREVVTASVKTFQRFDRGEDFILSLSAG